MGLMRTAAVKGMIPAGNKVSELRMNLNRLMAEMPAVMEERFGKQGLDAVSEVFRRLGKQDAETMKAKLALGSTLKDALDAWLVIGNVMGSKMIARWSSDDKVETDHVFCPQYEAFKSRGSLYCDAVCLPYVSAVAEGIAPGVRTEVVRPADKDAACVKALVMTRS